MKRAHVQGPPGTGKTTYLLGRRRRNGQWQNGQVQRAAAKFGPEKVMVLSLTKAAASEAGVRNSTIPAKNIGTVHSICYHSDTGRKILSREQIRDFVNAHPQWALSPSEVISDDAGAEATSRGLFARYDLLRHQMVDPEMWPGEIRSFDAAWSDYKSQVGAGDFTDLIQDALVESSTAPGNPAVILGDEAQDWSRLELALLLQWAEHCESLVLVGDRLQALYAWRGADASILDPENADFSTVLEQSYRVPIAVHARALRAVRGLPGAEAAYRPTMFEGSVEECGWTHLQPEALAEELLPRLDAGESAMVIAPCSFHLSPLLRLLRREGIPFQNPYSPKRGDWNRLRPIGIVKRILAWLRPHQGDAPTFIPEYTAAEVRCWAAGLRAEVFARRGKGRELLAKLDPEKGGPKVQDALLAELTAEAQTALLDGDPAWLLRHSTSSARGRSTDYIEAVLSRLGPERFYRELIAEPRKRPWLTVSTVHGVKGGEADHVAILPDLSPKGFQQKLIPGWAGEESLRRLAYVALTRARSRVLLGRPVSSARSLEI